VKIGRIELITKYSLHQRTLTREGGNAGASARNCLASGLLSITGEGSSAMEGSTVFSSCSTRMVGSVEVDLLESRGGLPGDEEGVLLFEEGFFSSLEEDTDFFSLRFSSPESMLASMAGRGGGWEVLFLGRTWLVACGLVTRADHKGARHGRKHETQSRNRAETRNAENHLHSSGSSQTNNRHTIYSLRI
jgi:hypothetical protein